MAANQRFAATAMLVESESLPVELTGLDTGNEGIPFDRSEDARLEIGVLRVPYRDVTTHRNDTDLDACA